METTYQGSWSPSMFADYCWAMSMDKSMHEYKKQLKRPQTGTYYDGNCRNVHFKNILY